MRVSPAASFADRVFAVLLWLTPTRVVSRAAHALSCSRIGWFKRALIGAFLKCYPRLDMGEAEQPDAAGYSSFHAFFTRALATGQRPLPAGDNLLVSPVDGALGAYGRIRAGALCQTKGMAYDLNTLLGGDCTGVFARGHYATFYLAPHDYHRVHMPLAGRLRATAYLPGRLFGVNPRCVRAIPRLFCRNERLVARFDTCFGPMAMVLVGAFIVGGIETRWGGQVCPPHGRAPRTRSFDGGVRLAQGDEMGLFTLGSSVIVLIGAPALKWLTDPAGGPCVRLNQPLARPGGLPPRPVEGHDVADTVAAERHGQ